MHFNCFVVIMLLPVHILIPFQIQQVVIVSSLLTLTVEPLPNSGLGVSADNGTVCEGTTLTITILNSESGVSYQLTDGTYNI